MFIMDLKLTYDLIWIKNLQFRIRFYNSGKCSSKIFLALVYY
jgi:hypothetical protein